MIASKLKNTISFLFLISVTIYFISPITDVDFPWHLKTGEYIYQHMEIPKTDPFSIVSAGDMRERFLLAQYWLGQVIFYILFTVTGPLGIILLRSFLFAGIIAILWFYMKNTPILLKIGILFIAATLFICYANDRPQLFSFFFAAVVVALLENFRKTSSIKYLLFLPLLMCLWANMHGGYIFGNITIAIICLSETVKYFFMRKFKPSLSRDKLLILVATGFVSVLVSYLNPNTYWALPLTLEMNNTPFTNQIREYLPPLAETRGAFANRNDFIYWAIVGYSLVLLALNLRRFDLTHLLLIFFALYISLSAVRFIPFYVIIALLISGQYRFNVINFENLVIVKKLKLPAAVLSLILVLCWGGSLVPSHIYEMRQYFKNLPETQLYPERAMQFLLSNADGGNVYCSYNKGSYLLYRLYPKFRTFIDSRGISFKAIRDSESISNAERWEGDPYSFVDVVKDVLPKKYGRVDVNFGNRPAHPPEKERWLSLLDAYKIDIIIHESCNIYTGMIYPLALRLIKNDQWKLVYSDGIVMIFIRDIPRFKEVISKHELDKGKVYDEIGMEVVTKLGRAHAQIYSSMAFALLMKGSSDNELIEKYIKHALYLNKQEILANYLDAFLVLKKRQEG
jgi:hypothetical protein